MKARTLVSAASFLLLLAACKKEALPEVQGALMDSTTSDRCGCMAPVETEARNASDVSVDLHWNNMPESVAYLVEVASQFDATEDFAPFYYKAIIEGTRTTVNQLEPNTRYFYRITTICGNDESEPSDIRSFVTADFHHGDPEPKKTTIKLANVKTSL
ncbi:MAG: fibronectin type III domain-containing protein [Lewinellaceae bacterium]|nr:fibronectin type III domain-containing protein [Lewinellaceae bacterium]